MQVVFRANFKWPRELGQMDWLRTSSDCVDSFILLPFFSKLLPYFSKFSPFLSKLLPFLSKFLPFISKLLLFLSPSSYHFSPSSYHFSPNSYHFSPSSPISCIVFLIATSLLAEDLTPSSQFNFFLSLLWFLSTLA